MKKSVKYFDQWLKIPKHHKFISKDRSGDLYSYADKPQYDTNQYLWYSDLDSEFLCVDKSNIDWFNSLVEV